MTSSKHDNIEAEQVRPPLNSVTARRHDRPLSLATRCMRTEQCRHAVMTVREPSIVRKC